MLRLEDTVYCKKFQEWLNAPKMVEFKLFVKEKWVFS